MTTLLFGNDNPRGIAFKEGNKKGEGCICLHLFTTGNITRHCLAVVTAFICLC